MLRPFLFSEIYQLATAIGVKNHVQQAKRALVSKWLDPGGGMVRKIGNSPIHHSRMTNQSAADQISVQGALFHPAVSFAGARTEIV